VDACLEAAKLGLELETRHWEFLASPASVAAPGSAADECEGDPLRLDAELRRLAGMRDRWDELLGHLAMLVRMTGLWRDMCFASFGHYCEERLGMAARTVEQRASLARRLHSLPRLRRAMQEGRLSYEKARLVASVADDGTAEAWIAHAAKVTCIALRREIEAAEEAQMCARGVLDVRVPRRVHQLLSAAFRAARATQRRWLGPGACLARIATHFIETWKTVLAEKSTPHRRVLARDGGFCQLPGCSRPAVHAHHVVYRSRGGGDDPANLVSLCAAHHLHGVHMGYIRVRGSAPDALSWALLVNVFSSEGGEARA
jgi:HNH endonuclease